MKKLLRNLRWLWLAVALFPAACHYTITSPLLWSHNSSAAFAAWVTFWVFCIGLPIATFLAIKESLSLDEEESDDLDNKV